MTTYELADLAQNLFSNSLSSFTLFLTIVFAYIVSAYLVGAQLTRTQVRMLTFVFVIVAILLVWSMAAYVSGGVDLNGLAYPDGHDLFFAPKTWLPQFVIGIGFVVLCIALRFMWDVRHPKTPKPD
jgi:hypothetical protein